MSSVAENDSPVIYEDHVCEDTHREARMTTTVRVGPTCSATSNLIRAVRSKFIRKSHSLLCKTENFEENHEILRNCRERKEGYQGKGDEQLEQDREQEHERMENERQET